MDKVKMEQEGWKLCTVSSGAHLKNWLEIYEEMDFEIILEKIDVAAENKDEAGCGTLCTVCYQDGAEPPYRVYVRSKQPASDPAEKPSGDR